jgi:hypothetical protein
MTDAASAPPPPPEAILLKRARESWQPRKLSMRQAAAAAGVSETTWRHAEAGSEVKGSLRFAYRVGDSTLARMARAARISPEALRSAGRPAAADVLAEMAGQGAGDQPDHAGLIPECRYETEILETPGGTPEAKRDMILGHRLKKHRPPWCRPYGEQGQPGEQTALPAALRQA